MDEPPKRWGSAMRVGGIVLVSLNLRASIAGFGPLLSQMQRELHASSGTISLLTTLPVLAFGLLAPVAPMLARRLSTEAVILFALVGVTLGAALRAGPNLATILVGTLLVGSGIAMLNVLLPGLVTRDFPRHTGLMTGVYVMALTGGASLAAGAAVPLRDAFGGAWRPSLGFWALLALVGVLAWLPMLATQQHHSERSSLPASPLWKDAIAWQVTIYMGTQSLVFFAWLTWLPKLLQDQGMTPGASGLMLSLANLVQIPVTLLVPVVAARMPNQQVLVMGTAMFILAGLGGLLAAPMPLALVSVLLLGAGSGSAVALALSLIVLRAPDSRQVANLSAMAQGVGYLLAGMGPWLFGWLHDRTGHWDASLALLIGCTLLHLVSGLGAGRARHVRA